MVSPISWKEELVGNGYFVVRSCVPKELLEESQKIMHQALCRLLKRELDLPSAILASSETHHQADIQYYLHQELQAKKIKRKLLLLPSVLEVTIQSVGPDLAYNRDGAVAINIRETSDNLYMKAMHQEIWSGAGVNELRIWAPLYMPEPVGGMQFIPGSHRWGFVANRKRMPVDIPKEADTTSVVPEVKEGDAVIFHSMTLHATEPNTGRYPRVAVTAGIRNIYHTPTGYEFFQSWQPYHLSPMARIQRSFGNPWLSPYRTLGAPLSHKSSGDGKREIDEIFE